MGPLFASFLQAGIDTRDTLFGVMDAFGDAPLFQAGCQIGHVVKLRQWRTNLDGFGEQTCGSAFHEWLAERGMDLHIQELLELGVDSLYVLQALSVEQLMYIGFGHGHIWKIAQDRTLPPVVCSVWSPCHRMLCSCAARNKGKVCNNPDPEHHARFCHCRQAHPDKIFRKPRAGAARIPWRSDYDLQ
jgi:hypothetical protein